VHEFASGWKRSYYGKADVIVYRLEAPARYFGANVTMLVYGDAFWPTYTEGDNAGLVATDSMKNFIQRESQDCAGAGLESYCRTLAERFLAKYPQAEGVQVEAAEIPYEGETVFSPRGTERAVTRIEMTRAGVVESRAGLVGFRLLRLSGSSFTGFIRDEYTTLPEMMDRPLHMWLDIVWLPGDVPAAPRVRSIVRHVFQEFESGSIQQLIYQAGTRVLEEVPWIAEVRLEANNRTWDKVTANVYTDPRPPYGVLGLTLRR
jgi:urate oxidase